MYQFQVNTASTVISFNLFSPPGSFSFTIYLSTKVCVFLPHDCSVNSKAFGEAPCQILFGSPSVYQTYMLIDLLRGFYGASKAGLLFCRSHAVLHQQGSFFNLPRTDLQLTSLQFPRVSPGSSFENHRDTGCLPVLWHKGWW